MREISRIKQRNLRIYTSSYLTYKYLWKNIKKSIEYALNEFKDIDKPNVLDVGCGNKPYKDFFANCNYIGMDWNMDDNEADFIGTGMDIPKEDNQFDIVFSTQVIEHVSNPEKMFSECYRVLKPCGILIMSGPFYWPLHEEPYDFHRFTKYGFKSRLEQAGFEDIKIYADGGTWAMVFLTICNQIPRWLFPLRIIVNSMGVIFDKIDYREDCPANYTLTARKPCLKS